MTDASKLLSVRNLSAAYGNIEAISNINLDIGAGQIVTTADLTGVDFVFPSSGAASDSFKHKVGVSTSYSPYTTVMAIASWKPVVTLLAKAGIAAQDDHGQWILDMPKYLALVHAGVKWDQLAGASTLYPSSKPILITSNDLRQSNSAAMYLAIASSVANKGVVANSPEARAAIVDAVAPLFLEQPAIGAATVAPFDDYLSNGMNAQPMVMIYESQFIARQITPDPLGPITPDMVMMYPSTSIVVKPGVVPLSPLGDLVGQILTTDGRITNSAAAHGFRPGDPSAFQEVLTANGLVAPNGPDHFADLPSYESLADLIATISSRYPDPAPGVGDLGLADQ